MINTAQKMNFSIKDFFSKCDQIRSFLRICWEFVLKKSLTKIYNLFVQSICDVTLFIGKENLLLCFISVTRHWIFMVHTEWVSQFWFQRCLSFQIHWRQSTWYFFTSFHSRKVSNNNEKRVKFLVPGKASLEKL